MNIRGHLDVAASEMDVHAEAIEAMWGRMLRRGWTPDQKQRFIEDVYRYLAQCLPMARFDEHLSERQRACTNWYLASEGR